MTVVSFLFAVSFSCFAGPVGPSIKIDAPASAKLGEPVEIQVSAALSQGETLALDLERSTTETFALTAVQELPGASPKTFRLSLLPLDLGKKSFPLFWKFISAGSTRTLSSVVDLEVAPPAQAAQSQDVKDIKPPARARPLLWPWLLLAAILLGIWYGNKRRTMKRAELPTGPGLALDRRPPEVIAEEELARLKASGFWEQGRRKEFYLALTDILRRYLERRYGFSATRETSNEIFRRLRRRELDSHQISAFKKLFDKADLVKFARLLTEDPWKDADLAEASSFVHETTPHNLAAEAKP